MHQHYRINPCNSTFFIFKFTYNCFIIGIWLHESGVLGASTDGFVLRVRRNIKVHVQGKVNASPKIIEVKCPFSAREMSIKGACANIKGFFLGKCRH